MRLPDRPMRLQAPPPRERTRRLRRLVEARRNPVDRALVGLGRLDQGLLVALRTRMHDPLIERGAQGLGTFGEFGAGWAVIGLGGAGLDGSLRNRFLVAATAGPMAMVANYVVKAAVGRDRPVIEGHPPLGPAPNKLSFPSAHATSSVAAAIALGRVAPAARRPLQLLAALVCVGRPYLGMHYPSDVLAGVALGYGIGRLYPLPRKPIPEPWPLPAHAPEAEAESR